MSWTRDGKKANTKTRMKQKRRGRFRVRTCIHFIGQIDSERVRRPKRGKKKKRSGKK